RIIEAALGEGRTALNPIESQRVLAAFHIPVLGSIAARDSGEALACARRIGFPLAMKLLSPDITHKTDVGGVRLDIVDENEAAAAYTSIVESALAARPDARIDGVLLEPMQRPPHGREIMLGIVKDVVFGPVISVELGGTMVEIVAD